MIQAENETAAELNNGGHNDAEGAAQTPNRPLDDTVSVYSSQHNLDAKAEERRELEADVERFLTQGGAITEVPRDHRADPPKRPESNYGRGSI